MINDFRVKRIDSLQGLRALLFLLIFFFHTSMIGNVVESRLYSNFLSGGGTEAVAFFFILSGFVEALHNRDTTKSSVITMLKLCVKKVKKFYGIHIFFLIFTIPTMIISIVRYPIKQLINLVIDLFLLQSWFSDESIWLSYNSVAWFISTLGFIFVFIIPLHKLSSKIEKITYARRIYCLMIVLVIILSFLLATHCRVNVKYYLYAFPPVRIIDYCIGFWTGRLFANRKQSNNNILLQSTILEIISMVIIFGYLFIYQFVDVNLSRAFIYIPGAIIVIYVFALQQGLLSKLLRLPIMVGIGNGSLYYMMSHQVLIRYCSLAQRVFNRFGITSGDLVWIIVALILTFVSKPIYDKLVMKIKTVFTKD